MRPRLPTLTGAPVHRLIRLVLLALAVGVAVGTNQLSALSYAAGLVVLGLLATSPAGPGWTLAATSSEGLFVALAISRTEWADSPFLPYLIAAAFTGALAAGVVGGVLPMPHSSSWCRSSRIPGGLNRLG